MRWGIVLMLGAVLPLARAGADGGYSPEEARARMVVPEGFRVEVFAHEPDVRQPVAACFDERGRMWVIEYLQYPVPAGLKPVTVDQYLRTEYDRVPEPPPRGPRGADRIKILEDTDGDGKADKVTTFLEGLNLASAIAVGHGGVYVGQAPYLLFYPDKDRDDRPDGDPEVLLSGFGLQDAHATVNSLAWGPDGWLYGAQGSTVTARIRGVEFQQGIWRFHPRTKAFELFAEGGGNTWGLDFDRGGHAFGSSNGSYIAFHVVQGGNYIKGFAKHGPLHNPRSYGYFESIAYDGPKQGGHVTPGGIIYKGGGFPPEFDGAFIGGNLLSNTVYWHKLSARGSTFSGTHGGTLIDAKDPWFRPIDLLTGPDGSLFVLDWYDRRASHLDPRDDWDKTNGRIYKIAYGTPPKVPRFDLATWSTASLIGLRTSGEANPVASLARRSGNDWWSDTARRVLDERQDPAGLDALRARAPATDEAGALRDLWDLVACGGFTEAEALKTLADRPPSRRRWAVRLIGDRGWHDERFAAALRALAAREADPSVRAQLAASAQRWPATFAVPILATLATRPDANDPHIPLLIWWGYEKALRDDPRLAVASLIGPDTLKSPIVSDVLLERTARALASNGDDASWGLVASLLERAGAAGLATRVLDGIDRGLEGTRLAAVPDPLAPAISSLYRQGTPSLSAVRAGVRLGSAEALAFAIGRVEDAAAPEAERLALIALLGQAPTPQARACLLGLLGRPATAKGTATAALNALANDPAAEVAVAIVDAYPRLDETQRATALAILGSRPASAGVLLDAIAARIVAPTELKPTGALAMIRRGDAAFRARLAEVWGSVPADSSETSLRRIAEVRGILPEGDKGDPSRGRAVFAKECAVCHSLFGEGEKIGPELTGSERGNLDFLLSSLVEPSALIRKEYQAQSVALKDGRVMNGMIVEENDRAITLFDSQRQKTVIPRPEVDEIQPSSTSLMPDGLLDKLPPDQIRDLFRYLQSPGPPPKM